MQVLSRLGGVLFVAGAALAGNWVGDKVRSTTSGEPSHKLALAHATEDGHLALGLNVALTNFIPALLLALMAGRPRSIYAFISGAMISALLGDSYERAVVAWLRGQPMRPLDGSANMYHTY
jgi:hypothetical protein